MSESKEIAVRATPETLAEMAISSGSTGIHLRWAKGLHCATVRDDAVSHWDDKMSALGVMRAWLAEQIRDAYDAGHAAGLSDLSKITAPAGTPLDEVADLRREVERLKEEAAKVRQDNLHLLSELGKTRAVAHDHGRLVAEVERLTRERDDERLDAERLTAEVARLRVMPKADAVVAGLVTSTEIAAAEERGRRKGWIDAIDAACEARRDVWQKVIEANKAATQAAKGADRVRRDYDAASVVVDAIRCRAAFLKETP